MTTILFIFALLTAPTDKYICDLWTSEITREGVIAACGISLLEGLRVDVYDLEMKPVCQLDAIYLNDLAEMAEICQLVHPLDEYVLRIVQPGYTTIICYVNSTQQDQPTADEIAAQCPQAHDYIIEFAGTMEPPRAPEPFKCPPRNLSSGFGLYDQAQSAKDLLTSEDLTWLAGKLLWSGIVKADCDGGTSGVNAFTMIANPCGMAAARQAVIQWQNQFDAEIYAAALANNVPAKLLKRMIRIESQFWPFYTAPAGEVGVMQVTDNGLDTLYRFDQAFDPFYLERDEANQFWSRSITRDDLTCHGCTLTQAIEHTRKNMNTYARLLAAFHCRAVVINPALEGQNAWRQTVVDYNGSADYLDKVE